MNSRKVRRMEVLIVLVFLVIVIVVMLREANEPIMKEPWDFSKKK